MSMKFEWDDAKAASNIRKHGIDFEDARLVFDDFGALEAPDDSMEYDEERFIITGLANEKLLTVKIGRASCRERVSSPL